MSRPTIFAETFDLADNLRCDRLQRTPENVEPTHISNRITLPGNLGAAKMDAYRRGHQVFVRLYHVQSGDFAWYAANRVEPSPSSVAVAHPLTPEK